MKKLVYLTFILSSVSFFSCNKEKTITPTTSTSSQISEVEEIIAQKGGLNVCYGFELKKVDGEYSCPSGDGCSKITTEPCDLIAGIGPNGGDGSNIFVESDYTLYQAALNGGTLPDFFSSSNWEGVFPMLHEKPDVLAGLISGELTIIELAGSMNSTMIVCVHHSKTVANFSIEDAYFSLQMAN